jgi:hypothetical protein
MPNRKERRFAAAKKRQQDKRDRRLLNDAKQYGYAFADGIKTLYKFKPISTPQEEDIVSRNFGRSHDLLRPRRPAQRRHGDENTA